MADGEELTLPGLGPVRLVRRGDLSALYRGRQLRFNREVAVKLFAGRVEGEQRSRFEQECAAMGALSAHPNIVTVFDSGVDRAGAYIVSEWLTGGSFADRLAQGSRLEWWDAVDVGVKLAGALASAHRAGVRHDNLKPQNVFLSAFGDPLLGDFAIVSGIRLGTRSSDTYDTQVHAAPERLEGAEASVLSDIYALASIIVTLALGHPPFATSDDESLVRVAARKAAGPPPDFRAHGASDDVAVALSGAMSVAAADRPASAAQLGRALQAAQQVGGASPTRMVAFPEMAEDETGPEAPAPAPSARPARVTTGPASGWRPERPFTDLVRSVVGVAVDRYRGREAGPRLVALAAELRSPVRVLVVGPPGAGKSTLVNGIIGEDVAPTGDVRLGVTLWYRPGPTHQAAARLTSGEERPVAIARRGREVELDLAGLELAQVDHVEVAWPSPSLAMFTLVDGPGAAGVLPAADAIVYVTPTWTGDDDVWLAQAQAAVGTAIAPLTTIVVLSAREDSAPPSPGALATAQAEAVRLRADVHFHAAHTVVAVDPVFGAAASNVGVEDLALLAWLAGGAPSPADITAGEARVLERFGAFGGRVALEAVRRGPMPPAGQLAHELVERSGLQELRDSLTTVIVPRCEIVRGHAALALVASILGDDPVPGLGRVAFDLDRARASSHQAAELLLLAALRAGSAGLRPALTADADRLLGGTGLSPAARLGLPAGAGSDQVARAVHDAIARWRGRAESPVSTRGEVVAARTVVRSGEGMLQAITGGS